jgi:hypothetical protein
MKTISVLISNPGHSLRELLPQYWNQLKQINGASFEKKDGLFQITFNNGTKLNVSNKISKQDEHRIYFEGSLNPICEIPFWFIKMKDGSFYELWDYYFIPGQGGFSILCNIE